MEMLNDKNETYMNLDSGVKFILMWMLHLVIVKLPLQACRKKDDNYSGFFLCFIRKSWFIVIAIKTTNK